MTMDKAGELWFSSNPVTQDLLFHESEAAAKQAAEEAVDDLEEQVADGNYLMNENGAEGCYGQVIARVAEFRKDVKDDPEKDYDEEISFELKPVAAPTVPSEEEVPVGPPMAGTSEAVDRAVDLASDHEIDTRPGPPARRTWPVLECEDCQGQGDLGTSESSGKKIACETCGGNEDSLGCGWIQIVTEAVQTRAGDRLADVVRPVKDLLQDLWVEGMSMAERRKAGSDLAFGLAGYDNAADEPAPNDTKYICAACRETCDATVRHACTAPLTGAGMIISVSDFRRAFQDIIDRTLATGRYPARVRTEMRTMIEDIPAAGDSEPATVSPAPQADAGDALANAMAEINVAAQPNPELTQGGHLNRVPVGGDHETLQTWANDAMLRLNRIMTKSSAVHASYIQALKARRDQ